MGKLTPIHVSRGPDTISVHPIADTELGLKDPSPITLSLDNQGAIDLAYNPEHHQRTKHIERRHFFIREAVERGQIRVPFVRTDDNIADFFTKPLSSKRFFHLRDIIMNVPARSSSGPDA